MKKIAAILVLVLMTALCAAAETPETEMTLMEGVVLEVREDSCLIQEALLGEVLVLIGEETVMETSGDIAPGDYVYVDYNGMMTRSLPPQITASVVRMHRAEGEILETDAENNTALLSTPDFGEILVNLPEAQAGQPLDATHMTVYFNGAMTMSLPAQVSAGMIVPGYAVQGVVTEIADGCILLGEGAQAVQAAIGEASLPEGLKVGDAVRVFHNGMMTFSIPARITAESIEIIYSAPAAE